MGEDKSIRTSCQLCDQPIEFPAKGLGMAVPCPHCGQATVLSEETELSQETEILTAGELKAAFAGTIARPRVSIFYQIALCLVAVFMILLPMIYIGFFALTGYGAYRYAIHAKVFLESFTGGLYVHTPSVAFFHDKWSFTRIVVR
jgi:hypothetical protein